MQMAKRRLPRDRARIGLRHHKLNRGPTNARASNTGSGAEILAAGLTPLDRWGDEAHRKKVPDSLGELRRVNARPGPKMIPAHIIAPHAPFVLSRRRSGPTVLHYRDGVFSGPREEYLRTANRCNCREGNGGSGRQPQGRPGPHPLSCCSVITGRRRWIQRSREDEYARADGELRRLLGPTPPPLYPTISVLNANRILANRYLGGALPLLQKRPSSPR
jgi:hypothetical protein